MPIRTAMSKPPAARSVSPSDITISTRIPGCSARKARTVSATTSSPSVVPQASRSRPVSPSPGSCNAPCASSTASIAARAKGSQRAPSSVSETARVVR